LDSVRAVVLDGKFREGERRSRSAQRNSFSVNRLRTRRLRRRGESPPRIQADSA